jgi:2,5-diketo-D-gluconate reductase B
MGRAHNEAQYEMSIPTLSAHGATMPMIGLGTSGMGDVRAESIATALKLGYRHIDTAWKYGTERQVGEGMRASGVPRADIFLCTKVSHEYLHADAFARSVDESLKTLGVDYVDLLLVHWPNLEIPLAETMAALAKAKRQGLARHVGVANFNISLLDQAIALCAEPLVTLQAEYHPYLDQTTLLNACRARGMIYTAYCPLGRGACSRIRRSPRSRAKKARPSRRWHCAGSSRKRSLRPSRAPPTRLAWPRTSRYSISRSATRR